jgi:hypothetical protein
MSAETESENWERLAAKYLRRLSAKDMRQWERHWRFEGRSSVPDAKPNGSVTEDSRINIIRNWSTSET